MTKTVNIMDEDGNIRRVTLLESLVNSLPNKNKDRPQLRYVKIIDGDYTDITDIKMIEAHND